MRENNGEELLPCPFCGGESKVRSRSEMSCYARKEEFYWVVGCDTSGCICEFSDDTRFYSFEDATAAWNTRHPDPVKAELVEALADMVALSKRESWDKSSTSRKLVLAGALAVLQKAGVQD